MSCLGEIGTTPERLVRPIVGLMPTTELELDGQIIEPSVSDPNDTATKFAATDIADPLLDPHGSADRTWGFCTSSQNIDVETLFLSFFLEHTIMHAHPMVNYFIEF